MNIAGRAAVGSANLLVARLQGHARTRPSAPALIDSDGVLDFASLWRDVEARVAAVMAAGIGPGSAIVVAAHRDRAALVDMVALMHVGATFVPVDARSPPELARRCTLACGGTLIVAGARLPATAEPVASAVPATTVADVPAYGIATSGTTGQPKVVMVSVCAFNSQLAALAERYRVSSHDRAAYVVSPAFDVSLEVVGTTWIAGAALVVPSGRCLEDFAEIQDYCDASRATIMNAPTAYVAAWARWATEARVQLPASVRLWVVGSEPCPRTLPRTLSALAAPGALCLNAYGLTETTITNTAWDMDPHWDPADDASVPVGGAIGQSVIHVLDTEGRPCTPGQIGRIHVGGPVLAIGYAGDPVATAERFRPYPQGGHGSRLFDTRDDGCFDDDGHLVVLGRRDRQVKIRGVRIEPDGIARAIEAHPAVAAAYVAAVPAHAPSKLVAWIIASADVSPAELQAFLGVSSTRHEVPSCWSFLAEFPRTHNGKIDVAALPPPHGPEAPAPATSWTGSMATAVREAFGSQPVDASASFLANGGDSLVAVALVSALRRRGHMVPISALWTTRPLGQLLDCGEITSPVPARTPEGFVSGVVVDADSLRALRDLGDARRRFKFFCAMTPVQLQMFKASHSAGGGGGYVEHVAGVLPDFDLDRFAACWAQVVERHDALRSCVDSVTFRQPMLACAHAAAPRLEVQDWTHLAPAEVLRRGEELLQALRAASIDVHASPPSAWTVCRLAEGAAYVIWTYHHLLLDGGSDVMLLDEAFSLYHGAAVTALPEPGSFRDLLGWLASRDRRTAKLAWEGYLGDLQHARPWLLSERDTGTAQGMQTMEIAGELPAGCWQALVLAARAHSVPVSTIVLCAAGGTIQRVTSAREALLGLVGSIRPPDLPRMEATAGMFLTLSPLRIPPRPSSRHADWWRSVFETRLAVEPHTHLSLEAIADQPSLGADPLFDTAIVFDNFRRPQTREARSMTAHTRGTLPCTIHIGIGDSLRVVVEYHPAALSAERATRVLAGITAQLEDWARAVNP